MATVKLPVFKVISDTFEYAFKNYGSVLKVMFIPTLIFFGFTIFYFLPRFMEIIPALVELENSGGTDPDNLSEATIRQFVSLLIFYFGFVFTIVILAPIYAAVTTVPMIRQSAIDEKPGWLRFDGATLRFFAMSYVLPFILMLPLIPVFLSLDYFVQNIEIENPNIAMIVLGVLAVVLVYLFFIIRLFLAPTDAAVSGEFRLSAAWQMTRGNVWRVVGLFILMAIIFAIIGSLIELAVVLMAILLFAINGSGVGLLEQLDAAESPQAVFDLLGGLIYSPGFAALAVLVFLGVSFLTGVQNGLLGKIYRELTPNTKDAG